MPGSRIDAEYATPRYTRFCESGFWGYFWTALRICLTGAGSSYPAHCAESTSIQADNSTMSVCDVVTRATVIGGPVQYLGTCAAEVRRAGTDKE